MTNQAQPFSREEQVKFLNRMLEAERAGAKALMAILDASPRHGEAWAALRRIHNAEAHNCVLIGKQIERLGADYSHATGDFLSKLAAVNGTRARVEFLAKGLRWAVARFDEAMPCLDEDARGTIVRIRESHVRSIELCESVVGMLAEDQH